MRLLPRRIPRLIALLLASLAFGGDPAVGEVLAGLAGCKACHTADEGAPWAGGYAIETEFGTFFGSNLTPDTEHGIGKVDTLASSLQR